ncbi:complement C1r-B subcomponent-like [Platysternon megacephalum]|uniref:Complement C1r-B subcomponent-like n=1 Tax=Platysternon megacephalum TaxID=55544 RepID=A0A4D9DJT9_9SAUR|nr:complement C1r-B subcomponent-like [Platysternon megacephalum]
MAPPRFLSPTISFVSEISTHIRMKAQAGDGFEDDAQYSRFFPKFIWAVRDFTLELKLNGQEVTEDDYLESALARRKGFGSLVQSYVGTIGSGQVPCLDHAVSAMAAMENEAALREALAHYAAGMGRLPAELGEVSAAHGTCEGDALRLFMQRSFKDEEQEFQKRLVEAIKESYGQLLGQNEAASKDSCCTLLETLSAAVQKQLSDGVYSQPGGYELYLRDRSQVVEDFRKTPNKGVKAEEVLEQFLASKRSEAESVLNVDKKMTEAEKDLATQRQKAEMLEQQRKVAEEKRLQTEQLMKDQERSHQENMKQLEAKMAEEAAHARREVERALQSKLKEQEAMLQQGFKEMAQMLGEEIADLRKEITDSKEQELLNTAKVFAKALLVACDAWGRDDEDTPPPPSRSQAGERTGRRV